jgi:hypothetical protein
MRLRHDFATLLHACDSSLRCRFDGRPSGQCGSSVIFPSLAMVLPRTGAGFLSRHDPRETPPGDPHQAGFFVPRRPVCHRLRRLACPAIRCRLRFLTDRRRRFMARSRSLNLGQAVLSPVNLPESRKFPTPVLSGSSLPGRARRRPFPSLQSRGPGFQSILP